MRIISALVVLVFSTALLLTAGTADLLAEDGPINACIGDFAPYISLECYGSHAFARWIQLAALKVGAAHIQFP